jgi:hypothetical protein
MSSFWASVITTVPFSAVIVWQGAFPHRVYSRRLSWHDAVFRLRDELAGDAAGFLAGNGVGLISEYTGRKLSEATSKSSR